MKQTITDINQMILVLGFWLFATSLPAAYGEEMTIGGSWAKDSSAYRSVDVTVVKVGSDMVFFRTSERTLRNTSMKALVRSGMASVKPGDQASLVLDRGNMIHVIAKPAAKALNDTRTASAESLLNR